MTELETLERAKMYMEKLANGINPIDGSMIPDEDIVNNVRLSRCFFYVADVLRQVIDKGGIEKQKKSKKLPFNLPVEQREAFGFSQEPLTVSEIVKKINELISQDGMARFSTTVLTEWLLSVDLLNAELNAEGKLIKRPTAQGEALGILVENRAGTNGQYSVVVYNEDAQHFVLDNLDAAIEYAKMGKENKGKPWSAEHDHQLMDLYRQNVPIKEIAVALKRNSGAIRARIKRLIKTVE